MGGGPYESSTAGQAMITYSHYSIFDTALAGAGKGGEANALNLCAKWAPGRESEALIVPFRGHKPSPSGEGKGR